MIVIIVVYLVHHLQVQRSITIVTVVIITVVIVVITVIIIMVMSNKSSFDIIPIDKIVKSLVPIAQPPPRIKCMIFPVTKNAMQSGCHSHHQWLISFIRSENCRWTNPIIGWISSRDAMQAVKLGFDSKEKAKSFAESNGWEIGKIQNEPVKKWFTKSYADNFRYSQGPLKLVHTK